MKKLILDVTKIESVCAKEMVYSVSETEIQVETLYELKW